MHSNQMAVMDRKLCVLSLAALCLVACGTDSASRENWTYAGAEAMFGLPPPVPRDNLSSAAWHQAFLDNMEARLQKSREAVETAKVECAAETGDSGTPDFWRG